MKQPVFLLGLISYLLFLLGVVVRSDDNVIGTYMLLTGIGLGAVHWACSMVTVFTNHDLDAESRTFWTILVMLVPPVGGMMYFLMKRKNILM